MQICNNEIVSVFQAFAQSGREQKNLYSSEHLVSWKRMVAVRTSVGPTIMLQSGAWFDFCAPADSAFTIEDIAQGLANICRYSGQCNEFYSVAEHSLLVSEVAAGFEFEALLHDAAEAFIGDITRPLKQMLPEYRRIESEVETEIFRRFGISSPLPIDVKRADLRVLAAEQRQIMPKGTDGWVRSQKVVPAAVVVRHLTPNQAKEAFLNRFEALRPAYLLRKSSLTQGVL
jgi:uncharacterized protein